MTHPSDKAPGWVRCSVAAVPPPLAGLLTIVVLVGLSWALLVPPWQSPDELAHYAYVESVAARGALPGGIGRPQGSTDQVMADGAVGAALGAFAPQSSPPSWSPATFRGFQAAAGRYSRADGGGANPSGSNPPLYYLYGAAAYLLDHGGSAFGRLYAIRLAGVLLLAFTALGAWLLAGEVIGHRRIPQLACAAAVGLLPMTAFMSTSVNPDALMITLWTWALWLGARVVGRGAARRDVIALGAVTAAAVLTKATSYALVMPTLAAFVLGARRRAPGGRDPLRRDLTLGTAALVVPILAWLITAAILNRPAVNTFKHGRPFSVGGFLNYLWQFYLPRLPFLPNARETAGLPVYSIWIRQGWGTFGWLDVPLPRIVYPVVTALSVCVAIAAAGLLARAVSAGRRRRAQAAYLAVTGLALLAFLHVADYRSLIAGQGALMQGRYLLPAAGLFGLAIALLVAHLPARAGAAACGAVLVGLLALQLISLSTVGHVYYS